MHADYVPNIETIETNKLTISEQLIPQSPQ